MDLINAVLGTELDPGHARLSSTAHRHIAEDHAADYPVIIAALEADAISAPTFIGQDPSHAGNFVLVKRIGLPDERAVLVAIGLEMAPGGTYSVRSSYLIPQRTIDARRQAGRLKIPPPRHDKSPARAAPCVSERDAIPDLLAGRSRLVTSPCGQVRGVAVPTSADGTGYGRKARASQAPRSNVSSFRARATPQRWVGATNPASA